MLIEIPVLNRIRDGEIDSVYRRWTAPRVKPGSQMRTAVGVLEVVSVELIEESEIGATQAEAAGFEDRRQLLDWLAGREGDVFCIGLRYVGPDPRIVLRDRTPDETEIEEIRSRLLRWDRAGAHGPWTQETLAIIGKHPGVRAEDLAAMLGRVKKPFKLDVRKLKELGLTESLRIGYRLSPRGQAVLRVLRPEA